MKIFVKMNSKPEEVFKLCGEEVFIATVEGCCDDNYFSTLVEAERFASEEKKQVYVGKLVWDAVEGEYKHIEV